jgi:dolichol-phosphate mannosyltransferase
MYVVVPLLNEVENIPPLIRGWEELQHRLPRYTISIILVDDGSRDGTGAVALREGKKIDLVVLTHETNKGPGYAFGTAFEYLADRVQHEDVVLTMEGDNTSRVELIPTMLERMEREKYDVVLASPYAHGGDIENTKLIRILLSHFANAFVKVVLDIRGIHTVSSFFRLYSGNTIRKLQQKYGNRILQRSGFESMVELLKKLIVLGASISEVPMKLDTSKRAGSSRMRVLRTIFGYLSLSFDARKWE